MTKTRAEIINEMNYFIRTNAPKRDIEAWVMSLSDDEREIIFGEVKRVLEVAREFMTNLALAACKIIDDFTARLLPELVDLLATLEDEKTTVPE